MASCGVSALALVTFLLTAMGVIIVAAGTGLSGEMLHKVISHKHCKGSESPSSPEANASPSNGTGLPPPLNHQRRLQEIHDSFMTEESISTTVFTRHLLNDSSPSSKLTSSDKKELYWTVGPLMVLGLLLLFAGFAGMMATCDTGCCARCNLFFHKVLLTLAVMLQIAIFIALFVLKKKANDDTNCLKNWEDKFKKNGYIIGGVGLVIQLLDMYLVFCVVTSRAKNYDSDDDDFGTSARPLLPRTRDLKSGGAAQARPSAQGHTTWSRRMREKYGLDTASLAQPVNDDPNRHSQNNSGSSCTIM